jgi:type I restriction enzyme M protein
VDIPRVLHNPPGTRKPRTDLVIFYAGEKHEVENAYIIVKCKAQSVKPTDRENGVDQLQSYMRACPQVINGMWTNGLERYGVLPRTRGCTQERGR